MRPFLCFVPLFAASLCLFAVADPSVPSMELTLVVHRVWPQGKQRGTRLTDSLRSSSAPPSSLRPSSAAKGSPQSSQAVGSLSSSPSPSLLLRAKAARLRLMELELEAAPSRLPFASSLLASISILTASASSPPPLVCLLLTDVVAAPPLLFACSLVSMTNELESPPSLLRLEGGAGRCE